MCSSTQTTQNTFQMVKMVMNHARVSKKQNQRFRAVDISWFLINFILTATIWAPGK